MHGLGNDFVIIWQNKRVNPEDWQEVARRICHRRLGVGADGLVIISPSAVADVSMTIINSDGSISEQCGNAIRCTAKYWVERINGMKEIITVETKAGLQTVWIEREKDEVRQIRVDMGKPILQSKMIPVDVTTEQAIGHVVDVDGQSFIFTAVSMGNPHVVIEVEDATSFPVEHWGKLLEVHPLFPRRTNVEFITVHSPNEITMRVWERGVGQTMACGSGACAALVASALQGRTDRKATIHLLGGDLFIEWNEQDDHVYMTGPAAFVYDGKWYVS